MSNATAKLISDFEHLAPAEKEEFAREFLQRLPPLDSGPLDDELVAIAGDDLAAMIQKEEEDHDAQTR